ncbi:ATP-binding protein, partial [Streptomyces sp. Act-28]
MSQRSGAGATTAGVPVPPALPARTTVVPVLRDLRDRGGHVPRPLAIAEADEVVVSGQPGRRKSTHHPP